MASSEKHSTWKGLVTAQKNFGLATLVSLLDKKQCESPRGKKWSNIIDMIIVDPLNAWEKQSSAW